MNLKIFAAETWHESPTIIGDRKALAELARKINEACDEKVAEAEGFIESDGEGFSVKIIQVEDEVFENLPVHYTDKVAKEKDKSSWKRLIGLVIDSFR